MEHLPNEILLQIAECNWEDTGSIGQRSKIFATLSRCCRRFYRLFEPELYTQIQFGSWFALPDINLIGRLWRNPELARRVQRMNLEFVLCGELEEWPIEPTGDTLELIEETLAEMFGPEDDHEKDIRRQHLLKPCPEAWAATILPRLINLKSFGIVHQHSCGCVIDLFNRAALRKRPFHQTTLPFPHLREVILDSHPGIVYASSDIFNAFFCLPSVRRFLGFTIYEGNEVPEGDQVLLSPQPYSRSVRELTVANLLHSVGRISWIDRACTKLEYLVVKMAVEEKDFSWAPEEDEPVEEKFGFKTRQFRQALLTFTGTLRELHLVATIAFDMFWRLYAEEAFGSFREFAVLETLVIRHAFLVGRSPDPEAPPRNQVPLFLQLPASLKTFEVLQVIDEMYMSLSIELRMLVQQRGSFPHLQRLRLFVKKVDESILRPLRVDCQTAGINLEVFDPNIEPWEWEQIPSFYLQRMTRASS
ncbi:hypothetical protein BP00DRAFT_457064 [Aspergillus indologenus CBS 114.80]|uniref:Uncharacterized protein n=1 Tax=Aspergillus indologenus CBS 114.80 TaxID=1450541 RepID=A0A2V5IRU7_9EURO|nr:hypothetical protein BP00DRAFT_457064 [Aspergillus indologenus CBS 114.80]